MVVREPHLLRAESQANSTLPVSVATETRGAGYGALPVSHRPEVGLHYPGDFPT